MHSPSGHAGKRSNIVVLQKGFVEYSLLSASLCSKKGWAVPARTSAETARYLSSSLGIPTRAEYCRFSSSWMVRSASVLSFRCAATNTLCDGCASTSCVIISCGDMLSTGSGSDVTTPFSAVGCDLPPLPPPTTFPFSLLFFELFFFPPMKLDRKGPQAHRSNFHCTVHNPAVVIRTMLCSLSSCHSSFSHLAGPVGLPCLPNAAHQREEHSSVANSSSRRNSSSPSASPGSTGQRSQLNLAPKMDSPSPRTSTNRCPPSVRQQQFVPTTTTRVNLRPQRRVGVEAAAWCRVCFCVIEPYGCRRSHVRGRRGVARAPAAAAARPCSARARACLDTDLTLTLVRMSHDVQVPYSHESESLDPCIAIAICMAPTLGSRQARVPALSHVAILLIVGQLLNEYFLSYVGKDCNSLLVVLLSDCPVAITTQQCVMSVIRASLLETFVCVRNSFLW